MPERCIRRSRLEARFLAANFTKLEVPVETEGVFRVGLNVIETVDFDMNYLHPAADSLINAMTDAGITEFYRLSVHSNGNGMLVVSASRADRIG